MIKIRKNDALNYYTAGEPVKGRNYVMKRDVNINITIGDSMFCGLRTTDGEFRFIIEGVSKEDVLRTAGKDIDEAIKIGEAYKKLKEFLEQE
jgi:hypothetical protein